MLVARAASVYLSVYLTNNLSVFKDEPNIPLSWQHLLNWGGLRGVIPLVLVFSLPDEYAAKQELFAFTFASLLFTLFVNGSTIAWLLKLLKLHLPSSVDTLSRIHDELFDLDTALRRLAHKNPIGISLRSMQAKIKDWKNKEQLIAQKLNKSLDSKTFCQALHMHALTIERGVYEKMLERQEISESVFYDLDAQLDLQCDYWEYPDTYTRAVGKGGQINSLKLFRERILSLRRNSAKIPLLQNLWHLQTHELYLERYMLLRARLAGGERVQKYLSLIKSHIVRRDLIGCIDELSSMYRGHHKQNMAELKSLRRSIDLKSYERQVLDHALVHHHSPWVI